MNDLWELIIFVVFILGGSCSLAGTWWSREKKKQREKEEHQDRKQ